MLFHQFKTALPPFRGAIICFVTVLGLVVPPCIADLRALPADQVGKAVTLLEQNDYIEALEVLHALESSLSDPEQIYGLLAIAYLGQGHQLLARREFEAAHDSFRAGRSYNEGDLRLWYGEAMTLFQQGRYPEAASLLNQAIGINPEHPEIYFLLGKAYYADGRMPEAVDALQRSLEHGDAEEVAGFLGKVRREWQIEKGMHEEHRGHFQLSFADGKSPAAMASDILEILEEAYLEAGADLAYYPDVRVPVLLYSHPDYAAVTRSPGWAGAVYDGKIRLEVDKRLAAILYHEYMHVLVHFLAGRNVPAWLNEGLAEISGRKVNPMSLADLRVAVASGQLHDWHTLQRPFSGLPADRVALAYEQSYAMAFFMVDSYGWHNMAELLESLGKQQEWPVAVAEAYREYGLDWPAIQSEWQATID